MSSNKPEPRRKVPLWVDIILAIALASLYFQFIWEQTHN